MYLDDVLCTERRLYILNLAGGFATLPRAQGEMMYFISVSLPDSSNPFASTLREHLAKVEEQKARVYYTNIEFDLRRHPGERKRNPEDQKFTFVTTSKEIHLGLGRMDWDTQSYLVEFLEHEFEKEDGVPQMLLRMSANEKAILITRTIEIDNAILYTLSPAN